MKAISSKTLLLLKIIGLVLTNHFCFAGTCWSTMIKSSKGRCSELLYEKISKENCCTSSSISTAWSMEEFDSSTLFFWRILGGGVPCVSCKDSCTNVKCETDKTCVLRKGSPKCVCKPNCKEAKKKPKRPVCGSDGRSYKSLCRLRKKACKQKSRTLFLSYYGTCQNSCDRIKCPDDKECVLDQNLIPHCVHCLRKACSHENRQICGSNGLTYDNVCRLREAACAAKRAIPVAYKGPCKENASCKSIHCPENQHCLVDAGAHGRPRCVSCSSCRAKLLRGPICGTNNNTYHTWCHMMRDSCSKGYVIETRHSGKCMSER